VRHTQHKDPTDGQYTSRPPGILDPLVVSSDRGTVREAAIPAEDVVSVEEI
jgi:hypothetical protein